MFECAIFSSRKARRVSQSVAGPGEQGDDNNQDYCPTCGEVDMRAPGVDVERTEDVSGLLESAAHRLPIEDRSPNPDARAFTLEDVIAFTSSSRTRKG